ncbi:MAG: energy-coupled thiamine transporter ThiT [Ruminococcaceae bacterium]|nr:energy-coupled thiamine transporter ThiT [Oscillospiraceae bacterium]
MTKKLTTSAMLIALSLILSMIVLFNAPYGGTVTAGSMVPVIIIGILLGNKWGLLSGFVYSLLQMLTGGIVPPPTPSLLLYVLVILLDYLVAFTVLGLSGLFMNSIKNKKVAIPLSGAFVMLLRFICHFLSGILIWHTYAPEGTPVWLYSLLYNGGYMLPEIVISTLVLFLLSGYVKKWKEGL